MAAFKKQSNRFKNVLKFKNKSKVSNSVFRMLFKVCYLKKTRRVSMHTADWDVFPMVLVFCKSKKLFFEKKILLKILKLFSKESQKTKNLRAQQKAKVLVL